MTNSVHDDAVDDARGRVARSTAAVALQDRVVGALIERGAPTEAAVALMTDLEDALEVHIADLEALLGIAGRPAPVQ